MAKDKKSLGMDLTSAVAKKILTMMTDGKRNKSGNRTGVKPSMRGRPGNSNMFK